MAPFLLGMASVAGPAAPCDPRIQVDPRNPASYRPIDGDRCEGIYKQQVSASGVAIVSFTSPYADLMLDASTTVRLEWPAQPNGQIEIAIVSLRPGLTYRGDILTRTASEGVYVWPATEAAKYSLKLSQLGFVATLRPSRAFPRAALLPLGVNQRDRRVPYQMTLLSNVAGAKLGLSVAQANAQGRRGEFILRDAPQTPSDGAKPVHLSLPDVPQPGFYFLRLGVRYPNGIPDTVERYFFSGR